MESKLGNEARWVKRIEKEGEDVKSERENKEKEEWEEKVSGIMGGLI